MKLGGKCYKEEKQHTRQSGDSSITSPFTPKKRKHSTEGKVLTEVRKKPNKSHDSEESDGGSNSESESGDSGSKIPSPAFDGIAKGGGGGNLGDTSDNYVEQPSAQSPKRKTQKTPSKPKDKPSPKKAPNNEPSPKKRQQ